MSQQLLEQAAQRLIDDLPMPDENTVHVRRVFELQQANRWNVARTTAAERIAKLKRLKAALVRHREALYTALFADFRKHRTEVEIFEIQPTLSELNHTIKHLKRWMRPSKVATPLTLLGTRSEIRYEPKGVVLILAPWNYPVNLLLSPLIAAVAAGNCAVVRPSEKTMHTGRVLADIIADAFPEQEVALVAGEIEVANALLELPFDHFFFTGSTHIGRKVMAAAAKHLAGITLELGGKSPVIVADADVNQAAERIVWGKFVNSGQTCVAPDYVLVHEEQSHAFVDAAKAALASLYGATETARQANRDLCRVIDDRGFERLAAALDATIKGGACVETGGTISAAERYIAPTILSAIPDESAIMREEIFGPILPVLTYRTLDEALAFVNERPKPLAMYIFSQQQKVVERVLEQTTAGGTVVNNVVIHLANPHLPFGGVGESGQGSYHGFFGFRTFSHERAVLRQRGFSLAPLFYPPYTTRTHLLARLLAYINR